ncbi:hypothetical protein Pla111_08290 [Botrimarina hoheduenensis]|uniref:ParB-like nuclease domain protein n=2 Tax=Botrimarina hoheduenensis TaxID=2528000 RepID=A0A5C5W9P6_9BACT|nr:hypothetical protein Pla111_08290 [Botrimarina hoheduenensis]
MGPFDQSLSDKSPIRVVKDRFGNYHILDGNHRVMAAREQELGFIDVELYTEQEWKDFSGLDLNRGDGTRNPLVE